MIMMIRYQYDDQSDDQMIRYQCDDHDDYDSSNVKDCRDLTLGRGRDHCDDVTVNIITTPTIRVVYNHYQGGI